MKTIGIFLAIVLISSAAFPGRASGTGGQTNEPSAADWQKIFIGTDFKVDCLSKKPTNPGYMDCYPTLDINVNVKNNQSIPASYNLDIFFLDHGKTRETVKGKMMAGKGYKFVSTTQCRDKKSVQISLESVASTNLSFHASVMDGKDELSVGWIGYIVRLSAFGKQLKTVASSKSLEKFANDPVRMEQLAAGKIVSAK